MPNLVKALLNIGKKGLLKVPAPPPPPAIAAASAISMTPTALTITLAWPEWLELMPILMAALAVALVYFLWHPSVPRVRVDLEGLEGYDVLPETATTADADGAMPCLDPATGRSLGWAPALSDEEVVQCVAKAKVAQRAWAKSSFAQRRKLLRILSRCTLEHAAEICRISARDSGKTTTDAAFGEVLVTLEKLSWLCSEGEQCLKPERRSAGRMLFYKRAWVEWHPRGVVGAIVPWNYPFHNVLNPVSAAVFAGNAIVIKVSEHAAWSARFYAQMIHQCLAAAGAPTDLVQLITGFGSTGATLTREVSLMTFVGSTKVGKMVMKGAAETLTPVVLELGGKDPFVLLEGTKVTEGIAQTAARGGWGAGGQNCIGAERFFIHQTLVESFTAKLSTIAKAMRQGPPLNQHGNTGVDIGAMCLPGEAARIQSLVDDAKAKGATIISGGHPVKPSGGERGQFFAPTIVLLPPPSTQTAEVMSMRLLHEEVFGPLITIIPFESHEKLVELVNGCPFALGSSVFGPTDKKVAEVGQHLQAGMLASNDFATCYMCQSLPMGGLKDSGFGKFAGVEGLRGLCVTKAVVEDIVPFMRTELPPPLRYPLSDVAFPFVSGLMHFFYGHSLLDKALGVLALIKCSIAAAMSPPSPAPPPPAPSTSSSSSSSSSSSKPVVAAAANGSSSSSTTAAAPPAELMAFDHGSNGDDDSKLTTTVPAVIAAFNNARLVGDVAASAACCDEALLYVTPTGRFNGLEACRTKTFMTKATPPTKTLAPMQPVPGGASRDASGAVVTKYYRHFEVKHDGRTVPLRQELHVKEGVTSSGATTSKIVQIEISMLQ